MLPKPQTLSQGLDFIAGSFAWLSCPGLGASQNDTPLSWDRHYLEGHGDLVSRLSMGIFGL